MASNRLLLLISLMALGATMGDAAQGADSGGPMPVAPMPMGALPLPPIGFVPLAPDSLAGKKDIGISGLGVSGSSNTSNGSSTSGTTSSYTTQATNIASTGSATYYAGVIQIAAGVTQVSHATQDRNTNGSTEANRQELVLGLTNLSSGSESVYKGRELVAHANSILGSQDRLRNVAQGQPGASFGLSFDRDKAGQIGNHVLNEMERVAEVPADTLVNHVNNDGNIYELAADAKGLSVSADELATAAETALAKAGKNPNPEVANGAKLSDLMKDLDMFMKKDPAAPAGPSDSGGRAVASAAKPAVSETKAEIIPTAPAEVPAAAVAESSQPIKELIGASDSKDDLSIFQMISRQYRKRDISLNVH